MFANQENSNVTHNVAVSSEEENVKKMDNNVFDILNVTEHSKENEKEEKKEEENKEKTKENETNSNEDDKNDEKKEDKKEEKEVDLCKVCINSYNRAQFFDELVKKKIQCFA